MTDLVTATVTDGVAQVRLNRPDKLNGLTIPLMRQLVATAQRLAADRSLRAVVLAGEGRSFSAGLDVKEVLGDTRGLATGFVPNPLRGTNVFQECAWAWRRVPVPVVAAVTGHCFGGGLQIALGADFRYTTADAQWSVMEAKWGLVPDMSGIRSLTELMPLDLAKRLTMTGEVFDGATAVQYGLATGVAEDPFAEADALVAQLVTRSPDALAATKRLFADTWTASPRRTFARERAEQARLLVAANTASLQRAAMAAASASFGPRGRGFRDVVGARIAKVRQG